MKLSLKVIPKVERNHSCHSRGLEPKVQPIRSLLKHVTALYLDMSTTSVLGAGVVRISPIIENALLFLGFQDGGYVEMKELKFIAILRRVRAR